MNSRSLSLTALFLNLFIKYTSSLATIKSNKRIGFENNSPDNTWVLRSTGDDIDYIITHHALVLSPGDEEWVDISDQNKNFIYQVCDTSGKASAIYVNGPLPMCAVYSGAKINITISANQVTVNSFDNQAIQSIKVEGNNSFYAINVQTLPPPECDLPYATQYQDQKWRMVNLEGATLFEPQFPYVCDLQYFAETGVNTVRLPFKWDYIQDFLSSDIPINWSKGSYAAQMLTVVNQWTSKNYTVILAMYNHMRYSYCAIGSSDCWVDKKRYAEVWRQIASQFVNNSRVVFSLMNEPNVQDYLESDNNGTQIVLDNQNAAARAIRLTGATQLILYSGNNGSNPRFWNSNDYGYSNSEIFIPSNIDDPHYKIEVKMFYANPESEIEQGCIEEAINFPQQCLEMQNPDAFLEWMNSTNISVIVGQTGGTSSEECIICINQGTMWAMIQNNIHGIGMWVGGHAWFSYNGSTNYPLYLAPIHSIPQKQMTEGFQNVSNPLTGELFLNPLNKKTPTNRPTSSPSTMTNKNNRSIHYDKAAYICSYIAAAGFLSAFLYLINRYKKQSSWCTLFKAKPALSQGLDFDEEKASTISHQA